MKVKTYKNLGTILDSIVGIILMTILIILGNSKLGAILLILGMLSGSIIGNFIEIKNNKVKLNKEDKITVVLWFIGSICFLISYIMVARTIYLILSCFYICLGSYYLFKNYKKDI